jgi:hypothetical protein
VFRQVKVSSFLALDADHRSISDLVTNCSNGETSMEPNSPGRIRTRVR